jgi:hypothetical protein
MIKRRISTANGLAVLFLMLVWGGVGLARIPEPDVIFYGTATLEDRQFTADDTDVTIVVKMNDTVLAAYTMGDEQNAGDRYVLAVPLDAIDPQESDTSRPGDSVKIYLIANVTEFLAATVTVGERGSATRLDIDATDTDGDGIPDGQDDDDDNDGLPDAFENAFNLNRRDPADAVKDTDFDSRSNLEEFNDGTDPQIADSDGDGVDDGNELDDGRDPLIPDIAIQLRAGFNLFALPVSPSSIPSSGDFLVEIGDGTEQISRLDHATNTLETTELVSGVPQGPTFSIKVGEGYVLRMLQDQEVFWSGSYSSVIPDLLAGINVVSFPSPPMGLRAFLLLQIIGDDNTISSIQRFNPATGAFETATYHDSQPAGSNYPVQRGEAYLITMHQAATGFSLPQAPAIAITAPVRNSVATSDSIAVAGSIDDSAATVTVNGLAAVVDIGQKTFAVPGVPLAPGVNVLTAVAENTSGLQGTATIRVLREE